MLEQQLRLLRGWQLAEQQLAVLRPQALLREVQGREAPRRDRAGRAEARHHQLQLGDSCLRKAGRHGVRAALAGQDARARRQPQRHQLQHPHGRLREGRRRRGRRGVAPAHGRGWSRPQRGQLRHCDPCSCQARRGCASRALAATDDRVQRGAQRGQLQLAHLCLRPPWGRRGRREVGLGDGGPRPARQGDHLHRGGGRMRQVWRRPAG
mmetsp:Transcript_14157/g.45225  ORF Transcript_14157/g.45225 Transcript_14157/m.45225 type:complete len:209 (-) Transcript_14157:779-1405(-)